MNNEKIYTINRRKRLWGFTWVLLEYSLPDENGNYQRGKGIADFGNIKQKENYQNAKKCKLALEKGEI